VRFGYDDGTTFEEVHLHVPAGTRVGIVGRTGSGKTTLGRLVLRLWDVDAGAVRVGGVDVRDLTGAELRRRVAVVTQDVELLRATVRENLTLFGTVPADDATLLGVLGRVGLGPWLAGLDGGLDAPLAGATGLSAGEAQLLATARVLVRDPGVVVLDEATSRLDERSEALVARATDELLRGRTVLVIAHRLSTLDQVDRIWVLEDGAVVEDGPRDELAADPASRFGRLLALARAGETSRAVEEPA
jgi:ATP-binding cassette subfamily B protein